MPNIEFSFYHSIVKSHNLLFVSHYLSFFYANKVSRALQAPEYFPGMCSSPKIIGGRSQSFKPSLPSYDALNITRVMQGKGKKQNKINLRLHQ